MAPAFGGKRRLKTAYAKVAILDLLCVRSLDILGVFVLLNEIPYSKFSYPLEFNGIELLTLLEHGIKPIYVALNSYRQCQFKIRNEYQCIDFNLSVPAPARLVMMVNSALDHWERRNGIHHTFKIRGPIYRSKHSAGVPPGCKCR